MIKLPLYMMRIRDSESLDDERNITSYALCDMTGEIVMMNTSETICKDIMTLCNKSVKLIEDANEYRGLLCQICVEIEPMEKPLSQIVTIDKHGMQVVADSPDYLRYVKRFAELARESGQYLPDKPIDERCQVIIKAYTSNFAQKSIPAYAESTLDCLVEAKILRNKGYRIVNNMDGSRLYCDEKRPRIVVIIRDWKGNAK